MRWRYPSKLKSSSRHAVAFMHTVRPLSGVMPNEYNRPEAAGGLFAVG